MKKSASPLSKGTVSLVWHLLTVALLLAINVLLLIFCNFTSSGPVRILSEGGIALHQTQPQHLRINLTQAPPPVCSAAGAALRPNCGPGNGVFDCLPAVRGVTPPPRRALVTFLQNDRYLAAVLTLAYTLRKHGNALPMILYTIKGLTELSPVSRGLVECAGWQIREWKGIEAYKTPAKEFLHLYAFPLSDCLHSTPFKLPQ
jgi:hypothetical protein